MLTSGKTVFVSLALLVFYVSFSEAGSFNSLCPGFYSGLDREHQNSLEEIGLRTFNAANELSFYARRGKFQQDLIDIVNKNRNDWIRVDGESGFESHSDRFIGETIAGVIYSKNSKGGTVNIFSGTVISFSKITSDSLQPEYQVTIKNGSVEHDITLTGNLESVYLKKAQPIYSTTGDTAIDSIPLHTVKVFSPIQFYGDRVRLELILGQNLNRTRWTNVSTRNGFSRRALELKGKRVAGVARVDSESGTTLSIFAGDVIDVTHTQLDWGSKVYWWVTVEGANGRLTFKINDSNFIKDVFVLDYSK